MENKSREYYLKNKHKWTNDYKKYATCTLCQTQVKWDHFNSSHVKTKKHLKKLELNKLELSEN